MWHFPPQVNIIYGAHMRECMPLHVFSFTVSYQEFIWHSVLQFKRHFCLCESKCKNWTKTQKKHYQYISNSKNWITVAHGKHLHSIHATFTYEIKLVLRDALKNASGICWGRKSADKSPSCKIIILKALLFPC